MTFPRSLAFSLLLGGWVAAGAMGQENAPAPAAPAVSAPELQRPFEGLYAAWREAMRQGDFAAWQQVTSLARQGMVRNEIVSQRQRYPEALFLNPLEAPDLRSLIHVAALSRGDTASSIYFGKADFGVSEAADVRDNFIVLRFTREFGVWKYDNLRVVKFGGDAEMLLKVRNRDLSFLEAPEFQPDLAPAPAPGPVNPPAFIAELWVTAVGYEAKVTINGQHRTTLGNDSGRELVNGGLARGPNRISVQVREIPVDAGAPRHLEIAVYGAAQAEDAAKRFFHYRSQPASPPGNFESTFMAPAP